MTPHVSSNARRLAAAGLVWLAATTAHAGVVISTYSHLVDPPHDPVYRFNPPFDLQPTAGQSQGVVSRARAFDNLQSRLPTGPNGEPVFTNITDSSGLRSTTNPGQTVQADAGFERLPVPLLGPAAAWAKTEIYANHASAATLHQVSLFNSHPVTTGGVTYEPNYFYREHLIAGVADSAWFQSWTAAKQERASIQVALDGHLGFDPFCSPGVACNVPLPFGTDAFTNDRPLAVLNATFIVYDLTDLAFCAPDDLDECGQPDVGHPLPMVILTAKIDTRDESAFDYMDDWSLDFETQVGHRYLAVGAVSVEGWNGGVIDFFNTMRMTGIDAPRGTLFVDATGRDLVDVFARDAGALPEPAMGCLLLLAGGAAAVTRRRR